MSNQIIALCDKIIYLDRDCQIGGEAGEMHELRKQYEYLCIDHAAKLARALKESLNFIEQRRDLFVEESCEECGHFTSSRYTDPRAKEFLEEIEEIFK